MLPEGKLTPEEKQFLLGLARQSMESAVKGQSTPRLDPKIVPLRLQELGASFVTLTIDGELRGCIGALEATLPLFEDVRQHAVAAALHDFRFLPVRLDELPRIKIEISWLSLPVVLDYVAPDELLVKLRPRVDGVLIRDGLRRATFLPQVWDKLPETADFLDHLCAKMGVSPQLWRQKRLDISIYTVEEFSES